MASGKSTYWANHLLDLICGASAFSAPGSSYLGLYTAAPGAGGGGTEATGTSYARASNTNNSTTWPASSGGVKSNGVAFTFATCTDAAGWSSGANMVACALMDALTGGNELYFGGLTTAKPVLNGDAASFAIGQLSITET